MKKLIAASGLALTLFGGGVQAVVINPGFETGDFTGWSTAGTVSVIGPGGGGPTEGLSQALLTNSANQDLSAFLGVALPSNMGGGAITQTFSVASVATLEFDWNFLTNENTPSGTYNDFAFYVLDGVVTVLADTFSTFGPGDLGFSEQTGYATVSVPISAGSHALAFGVVDVSDQIIDSGLLVDRITVTTVSEPASLTLFGLGLASLTFMRRRASA